jgi:hypothetical protein
MRQCNNGSFCCIAMIMNHGFVVSYPFLSAIVLYTRLYFTSDGFPTLVLKARKSGRKKSINHLFPPKLNSETLRHDYTVGGTRWRRSLSRLRFVGYLGAVAASSGDIRFSEGRETPQVVRRAGGQQVEAGGEVAR